MSLVVKQAALSDMENAMTAAHDDIVKQVHDVLEQVNSRIQGWSPSTASRAAEMDYQRRLSEGVEKLASALDTVRTKLAEVANDAHEAEVENVAIVD
jgi:uncharacterized protein YukE